MQSPILYHGSTEKGLTELLPQVSDHGEPYVYLTENIVVAAFYTVRPVARPYNWYPYGFIKGVPCYTEYYPGAMADVYQGKPGVIYLCGKPEETVNPTNIYCAALSPSPVKVQSVLEIGDMYRWFLEREKAGELILQRYGDLSEEQKAFAVDMITNEIRAYRLKENNSSDYARMICEKFPQVWEKT